MKEEWRLSGDVVFGLLMLWTIAGLIGNVFGLHFAWWDMLGFFPADPRRS